jgi:hypothetical protein
MRQLEEQRAELARLKRAYLVDLEDVARIRSIAGVWGYRVSGANEVVRVSDLRIGHERSNVAGPRVGEVAAPGRAVEPLAVRQPVTRLERSPRPVVHGRLPPDVYFRAARSRDQATGNGQAEPAAAGRRF